MNARYLIARWVAFIFEDGEWRAVFFTDRDSARDYVNSFIAGGRPACMRKMWLPKPK